MQEEGGSKKWQESAKQAAIFYSVPVRGKELLNDAGDNRSDQKVTEKRKT
ncbi:hypothetical protein [Flavisolibacter nicotianae]|nr:hypothetical protein [Flavisolibacter nicotianae]